MIKQLSFGEFLCKSRLEAQYGLRQFAREIGWQPSNLSNVEHGRLKPPQDKDTLATMAEVLGFDRDSDGWKVLFDLAARGNKKVLPADVEDFVKDLEGVPVLFRTMKDKKITESDLEKLVDYVREHYGK